MNKNILQLIITILSIVIYSILIYKLLKKTGNKGGDFFLALIPVVNLIYLSILAYGTWPIERELERYKEKFGILEDEDEDEEILE